MSCSHEWYIYGSIGKPHVKYHYHNNIVFKCTLCPIVHITINNRQEGIMEFPSIDALAEFCIRYRYTGVVWPTVSE